MHPLAPDLNAMSDSELQQKHAELTKRITQAYRMGNGALVAQVQMLLDDYQGEISRRQQAALEKMMKDSDKFNGIIDIQ
jgi:hypothetical protein